jgi:hypothetical protein
MKIALALGLAAVVMLAAGPAPAQEKKKGSDQTRSVQGVVTGPDDKGVEGAIVQLKNTKTLQIRSFVTPPDGAYYFRGLSPDIDYELTARTADAASGTRTLSAFDNRKEAIMNLRVNPIKK